MKVCTKQEDTVLAIVIFFTLHFYKSLLLHHKLSATTKTTAVKPVSRGHGFYPHTPKARVQNLLSRSFSYVETGAGAR